MYSELLKQRIKTDMCIGDISKRVRGRNSGFTNMINHDDKVAFTNTSNGDLYRYCDGEYMSDSDFVNIQTFPQDYDFGTEQAQYVCGMSVPPVMMANIATEIYGQWLK